MLIEYMKQGRQVVTARPGPQLLDSLFDGFDPEEADAAQSRAGVSDAANILRFGEESGLSRSAPPANEMGGQWLQTMLGAEVPHPLSQGMSISAATSIRRFVALKPGLILCNPGRARQTTTTFPPIFRQWEASLQPADGEHRPLRRRLPVEGRSAAIGST